MSRLATTLLKTASIPARATHSMHTDGSIQAAPRRYLSIKSEAVELTRLAEQIEGKNDLSSSTVEASYALVERLSEAILQKLSPLQFSVSLAEGHCQSIALHLVNQWKLADIIGNGRVSLEELAEAASLRLPYLRSIMTAVHHHGYFDATENNGNIVYANNDLSSTLQENHPMSVHQAISFIGDDGLKAASRLGDASASKETKTAYQFAYNTEQDYFAHVANKENQWRETRMGQAMKELHRSLPNAFATEFDWHALGAGPLVDVGGGQGTTPMQLYEKFDKLNFVLFDRPTTIDRAKQLLPSKLQDKRLTYAAGDFFQRDPSQSGIPTGQPYYLVRNVLHDWDDEQCVDILRNIRAAMLHGRSKGQDQLPTLFVSDLNLSDKTSSFCYTTSIQVMALGGGTERRPQEYRMLLQKAGFEPLQEYSLGIDSIISARPVFD